MAKAKLKQDWSHSHDGINIVVLKSGMMLGGDVAKAAVSLGVAAKSTAKDPVDYDDKGFTKDRPAEDSDSSSELSELKTELEVCQKALVEMTAERDKLIEQLNQTIDPAVDSAGGETKSGK